MYVYIFKDFSYINGLVLKGNRIVIPKMLQNEMKTLLHYGHFGSHFGIEKIKNHAREMFWPRMNNNIENIVRPCNKCQQYHKQQQRETFIPHEMLDIPWTKVGTDLFEIYSKSYLIVVDYTQNFFDISKILDKRSSTVILYMKRVFSRYSIPKEVISDNGPEFIGNAYKKFSKKWFSRQPPVQFTPNQMGKFKEQYR